MTLYQAKSKISRMKKLLREMEFTEPGFLYLKECHFCGMTECKGHAPTCKLAKELR